MKKTLAVELPWSFLKRFLRVFRKGGLHRKPKAGSVEVRVRDNVVTLRSANNVLDLTYRWECHRQAPDWTFCVSQDVLSLCGARLNDKVTFQKVSSDVVRAHWFDAGIPQEAEFTLLPPVPHRLRRRSRPPVHSGCSRL